MPTRSLKLLTFAAVLCLSAHLSIAETIEFVTLDEETNDAWRTTDSPKPDADGDNVYGTAGYLIAQYPEGDEVNLLQPPFGTIEFANDIQPLRYEGVGAEAHQAEFDDVLETGPGPVPDLVAGDYWILNGGVTGDEHPFFYITLDEPASFRLGVIVDQTPDNPPGLLWEAAREVRIEGPTTDSDYVDVVGPNEEWRDADVDYALFDITGDAGDTFTVWGVQDDRWRDIALGGVTIDLLQSTPGDFNGDGELDEKDIDLLFEAIREGKKDSKFDVNSDGDVNPADLNHHITDASMLNTWIGDANLDGEFNSSDFVQVFTAGLYESESPSRWREGDWDGSGLFDSGDFVAAFTDGGYESGPRQVAAAVPEPGSAILLLAAAPLLARGRRRACAGPTIFARWQRRSFVAVPVVGDIP